jgi:hypothetical protein
MTFIPRIEKPMVCIAYDLFTEKKPNYIYWKEPCPRLDWAFSHSTLSDQSLDHTQIWTETYSINDQCLSSDVCTCITRQEYRRSHEILRSSPPPSGNPIETVFGESWILAGDGIAVAVSGFSELHVLYLHVGSDTAWSYGVDSDVVSAPFVG